MNYYRRRQSDLDSLLRWRRNVFIQTPAGYLLVAATQYDVCLHSFGASFRSDPLRTIRLDLPEGLYGQGWDLLLLIDLLTELSFYK